MNEKMKLFYRYVFQGFFQEFPEFADRGDVHPFIRGVGGTEGRTERNHVPVGVFGPEDAAFQAGVYRHDGWFLAVELFINILHFFQDG